MPANQRPVFALLPKTPVVNLDTANTATAVVASPSDSGSFRQLYACAIPEGAKCTLISYQFIGTGTPSAGIFYIWLTDNTGANARVVRGLAFGAGSAMTATVAGPYLEIAINDLQIQNGQKIFVSVTTVAANTTLNVRASVGEFA
jgi:hypothetical protein